METISTKINGKLCAEYEVGKVVDLNSMGNFYRGNSIHNDVLTTIEGLQGNNHEFNSGF